MESGRVLRNSQIIILGVCIAFATVASSVILSRGFMKLMKFTKEVISVTGSANKLITSDLATWDISFARRNTDLAAAYQDLKKDLDRVKSYLRSKGIADSEMVVSQVYTVTLYKKNSDGYDTNEIEGYRLSQSVTVRSPDVDRITALSRGSTELINEGIAVNSSAPQYFYTKIDELKVEMLARATETRSSARPAWRNPPATGSAPSGPRRWACSRSRRRLRPMSPTTARTTRPRSRRK